MPTSKRSRAEWLELIQRQEKSGKPIRVFCRENGINEGSFNVSKSRLLRRPLEKATRPRQVTAPPGQTMQIRKGDLLISLPCECDVNWLAQVVKVLCA